ncbi:lactonase family protein [uncultured Zobellia sp.]|uniref:lactonase family protein n=1 Tax=uncultured Zobellia sp. TaxID=255433 RepID=UPI00259910A6|nr:lactonase family protein [uncultured Zobellia sp.]
MKVDQEVEKTNLKLLVGTHASEDEQGIYQLEFNTETGELTNSEHLVKEDNSGYLYLSKDGKRVYSSNGTKPGSVSAFEWNDKDTELSKVSNFSSEGDGACYIELSPNEDLLAAANYGSGGIVLYSVDQDGKIIGEPTPRQHKGNGPHKNQKSPHAHCVKFSKDGNFLYAVDLGIDKILAYPISNNTLEREHIALQLDPGDGPRHLIFHPTKNRVFIINELYSSVVSADVDPKTGTFKKIDKKSTLPEDFDGFNACADIHLSNDGKFLYASNRGHNSIAVFSVSDNGMMNLLGTEPVQGDWPRNFTLSPDNNFLLVANRKTDNITVFKRNANTGLLSFTGHTVDLPQPVCLKFR